MEDHRQLHLQCPADSSGRLLCWDDRHCQKKDCPTSCGGRACFANGTCCHSTCLGGCDGPLPSDCHVCANFSFRYGSERTCMERCPANTYELDRRCVTEQECRSMPVPQAGSDGSRRAPNIKAYKILHNRKCVYVCPSGYMEPCPASGCVRECAGGKVDSVASAELFRGCTHVRGNALGEIREIEGALRVVRSYPLVSLMFLKSLQRIGGRGIDKGQSLYIFNNPNLEMLWDWSTHKPLQITSGRLFIHFNPKLCYNQILPLKNMTWDSKSTFSEMEVSQDNNGDQASCFQDTLHLKVSLLYRQVAILTWDMYCLEDTRKLLGYSIYYIAAERNVTLYGQRDACSDTSSPPKVTKLTGACGNEQPLFYPLTQLTPHTRPPLGLTVESVREHSATIKWQAPTMPNGTIETYRVEIQANAYNQHKILAANLNYCSNPSALVNMIAVRGEEVTEKKEEMSTGVVKNGSCACKPDRKPSTRFTSGAEEERVESIHFENELQNHVYVKSERKMPGNESTSMRVRRSVESTVNSMLVILSDIHVPKVGSNYTNETEGGFAKSLYFELSGSARSLSVGSLRHFTWYTVNIWACRAKHENETMDAYAETWCSVKASYNFRTLEKLNADVVRNLHAEMVPSNKTLPEVNVTWLPPEDPNGFVYATGGRGFVIRSLAAGNYSVRVTPLTVSGMGNVSTTVYIYIPLFASVNPEYVSSVYEPDECTKA
ncbi:unnamed protein product [Leptidea sinapis]|uniref:receptor protein-tyrosine kinase n=1 Tax=Leptidea sinapis TaxID=189913 RepID=A0A5E4R5J7_9NEOP|nr:unnamed protein product [Leptidea sinapis]